MEYDKCSEYENCRNCGTPIDPDDTLCDDCWKEANMEEKRISAYQKYWRDDLQIGDVIVYYDQGSMREGLIKGMDDCHVTIHRTGNIPIMTSYVNVVQIYKRREHLTDWWIWL